MLAYPYILTPDDNGTFLVTFPDIPEAAAVGEDEETAAIEALDGLLCALDILKTAAPCRYHRNQPKSSWS